MIVVRLLRKRPKNITNLQTFEVENSEIFQLNIYHFFLLPIQSHKWEHLGDLITGGTFSSSEI